MVWLSSCNQKTRQERNHEYQLPAVRIALSARVGINRIKARRLPICYRNHHLRQPDIDILDMDNIRQSFSKLKKDFEHRVRGKKRGAGRAGADAAGEAAGSSLSLTRPDSRATASGLDGEGGRISTDALQAHSRDRPTQPKPTQADEGRDNPQGREADVDEKGASQSHLRLASDVVGAAGSRPNQEITRAPSPLSVALISPKQESDSTWTFSSQQLCLIALLDSADTPVVPDRVQGDPHLDENAEPSAVSNEKKSNWKSTTLATAKLLLRGVRDSADAFGPLKSVAGGLCFILENCEVWSGPCLYYNNSYTHTSE